MRPIWKARDQAKVGRKWRSAQPCPAAPASAISASAGERERDVRRQGGAPSRRSPSARHWQASRRYVRQIARSICDGRLAQAAAEMGVEGPGAARPPAAALRRGRGRRRPRPRPRRRADRAIRGCGGSICATPATSGATPTSSASAASSCSAPTRAGDAELPENDWLAPGERGLDDVNVEGGRDGPLLAFLHLSEARRRARLRRLSRRGRRRRARPAAVFAHILRDEEFHMNYTRARAGAGRAEEAGPAALEGAAQPPLESLSALRRRLAGLIGSDHAHRSNISSCCRPSPGSRRARGAARAGGLDDGRRRRRRATSRGQY